jgi:hypothetical protein
MTSHTDNLLNRSDEYLFTKGGCHVFALCLADSFGYPLRLLRNTSVPEPGGIVHVYCLPAPDIMVDFAGHGSERAYLRSKCYDSPPYHAETVCRARLQELSVEQFGHGGLYAEVDFLTTARARALAVIEAAPSKYGDVERSSTTAPWTAARNLVRSLLLASVLAGCSDDRKVVLSDETGSRTLVYPFGSGFVPRARTPEDLPVLAHSFALAVDEAARKNDVLTVRTLRAAWKERDYRSLERTIVEFRFRELERSRK